MIKKLHISVLLVILSMNVFSQGIKVSAKIDSGKILIGDHVKMNVSASYVPGTTLVWPELKDELTDYISIINKSKIDTLKNADTVLLNRTYTLTSYDSGSFYIPSILFQYKSVDDTGFTDAYTDSILLDVKSISVDTTKAIRDIKGPIEVPRDWKEFLPYAIGAVVIIALALFLIYYFRKIRKSGKLIGFSKPKLLPHEEALQALEKLKDKKLWQNNKVKEYHTELTEIIRVYIEKRFGVAAMEMTSDNIIDSFRSVDISEDLKSKLRQIFVLADLVKFAKASPLPNEHDLSYFNACAFVRETIPQEVTNPEETSHV